MSDQVVITVRDVYKSFRLPHEKHSGLKQALINFRPGKKYEMQQVLSGVSFDIMKGEFFGIVGRNGSGKSTLLKLLAQIYTPEKGAVSLNGSLTPFIELGVGFNPELTGRENIFLNGALLGFDRKQMNEMYDEIVEFAELEQFMDQKLKNYSSGMQVRLAFAIAIQAKSDVLLLDEVLAVGDAAFQRKCLDIFEKYKAEKQTIILVTHDMGTVKKYCSRAALINDGNIVAIGNPHEVAEQYSNLNKEVVDDYTLRKNIGDQGDLGISLRNRSKELATRFNYGEAMTVRLKWPKNKEVLNAGVAIYTTTGECVYATNTFIDNFKLSGNQLDYRVDLALGAGRYYIMAGTFLRTKEQTVDFVANGPEFTIDDEKKIKGEGVARLPHAWEIN